MKRILILCTHNSCRSQMAEGFLRHFLGNDWEVESAGTQPSFLHPLAVKAMAEVGIDISHHRAKAVNDFLGQEFEFVITVCDQARESCPIFPGTAQRIHWNIEDPTKARGTEEEKMVVFRKVRDQIARKTKEFSKRVKKKC